MYRNIKGIKVCSYQQVAKLWEQVPIAGQREMNLAYSEEIRWEIYLGILEFSYSYL